MLIISLLTISSASFSPPSYNESVWSSFASKTLLNPLPALVKDPYLDSCFSTEWPDTVCAVVYPDKQDRSHYRLENFENAAEAEAAGGFVTHSNPCGYCSSLQDLSVYMKYPDLTGPARKCAIKGLFVESWGLECLADIGFTDGCSKIWLLDSRNTRRECFSICVWEWIWGVPSNVEPDSQILSECIECDEVKSGPIFKVVAGRNRRNSGLKSSINRPNEEIYEVYHYYF